MLEGKTLYYDLWLIRWTAFLQNTLETQRNDEEMKMTRVTRRYEILKILNR